MAPHCLYVCRGGKNKARGVWAVHPIESGVWFGPLEGDALPADKYNGPTRWHFAWEIYCGDGLCKLLIVKDGSKKDWLRHVTSTYVPWTGVNMAAYQFRGQIYYVTTKFIGQGQKLVLGLNHASYDGTSIDEKELSIRSKGFGVSMKCSLCHRQHDDTPVPARRGDWRSQAKNLDVQIDDCFPILKLSASEVHKQQLKREMHVVGRTKNSTTNGRRKFLNRLFRCHLCGWRFPTFVRYASHKRNHELRYLKFRLQPCPKLSKQFDDDMMSPLKSDVNHSEYGFSMSDVHFPPTLTPVDEEARVKSAEAAIVSQRELNSTENFHDDCSELVQRGQKQEHLSNNEVGTDVKTKMPQKFEKQQENDIKRRHLRQRKLAAKCHEAPHRKQPASQRAKEKNVSKLNGGSNVVNGAGKSDRFTCTRCDKSFSSNANLKKHTRVHTGEKPFVCNYCGKRFTEISNLNTHLRVHTGHSPYKCTICGKKFKYLKGFKLHMSQHGRAPVTYKCSFCDREFSHKGPCKTHENSHQRERPFKCKICNMKFKREGGLQMHTEKMHPPSCHGVIRRKKPGRPKGSKNKKVDSKNMQEDRPHQCKRCGKAFKYNYSLRQHTRTHTGERPFKCTLCDAAFSQSSNLTSHRRIHTGEAPYKCRHCEKRFTCAQNLRSHLRVHTGERPYQCPQCPARFAYSSYLKTHSLVHSDRKPLRCSTCGKEYRHPTSFKIHLRTHSKK